MKSLADMIAGWAQDGAALGVDHGRMCDECAFRKGSVAQTEEHTVSAAADCIAFYGKFNCHENGFEDAGRPCAGFLYAQEFRDHQEKKVQEKEKS